MDYAYGPGRDLVVDGALVLHGMVGGAFWDEGFTATDVVHSLAALGPAADVTVRINSSGGIAHEGLAIHAVLSAHKGKVTTVVEGLAASAASIIVQAGDERVMSAGAMMMVHDAAVITIGDAAEHDKSKAYLEVVCASMATIYAEATGRSLAEVRAEMAAETWLTAEDAVAQSYADRVGAANDDEPAPFPFRAYAHAPQRLVAMADAKGWSKRPLPTAAASATASPQRQMESPMPNDPAGKPPAKTDNVVDLDAARAEGRTTALAYVREVHAICATAGKPEAATAFIEKGVSPLDVAKELLAARASADAARDVSTQTLVGAGAAKPTGSGVDAKNSRASMERELKRAGVKKDA